MALYQRLKRQILSKVILVRIFLILLSLSGALALYFLLLRPLGRPLSTALPDHAGRTNFLLLGIAGGEHDGRDLTDTIIFASLDKSTGDALLISIPRDLWIPSLRAKINTAYHYGEEKQPGGGIVLAKSAISEAINQQVDYVAVINFSVFERAIDLVGGLNISVSHPFTDLKYPVPGREADPCESCRYQTVSFVAGPQHMDGATALKFVRSRNAEGDEGTDFARSVRQEKIISAFKQKLFSPQIIFNFKMVNQLKQIASQSIVSNITPELYTPLLKLAIKSSRARLRTTAITEPLVYNPPISAAQDYQWVLLPKDNKFQTIADYVTDLLEK